MRGRKGEEERKEKHETRVDFSPTRKGSRPKVKKVFFGLKKRERVNKTDGFECSTFC